MVRVLCHRKYCPIRMIHHKSNFLSVTMEMYAYRHVPETCVMAFTINLPIVLNDSLAITRPDVPELSCLARLHPDTLLKLDLVKTIQILLVRWN
jgi:hypothetical protein